MSNNGNNAKRATIGGVIDKFFEIPPYQRLYEWEKEQIETLLDDIKKACELDKKDKKVENKKEYFIGTITISAKTNDKEQDKENNDKTKVYKLIDGQQRLTTIWFIGFYLASRGCTNWQDFIIQKQDDKLRIAMPIRDSEENALKALARKITDLKGENSNKKNEKPFSFPQSNINEKIKKAFECIESWFENIEKIKENEIKDFAQYIYTKVCFVLVTLAENTDLNRFFVRMNNRGKQLEKHEILKVRILATIKGNDNGDEWQKYAKIWDLCSDMDKYIFQSNDSETYQVKSIIDFPTFLLHCYKLFTKDGISITRDKLLDIMWEKNTLLKDNSENCITFIESMLRYRVLFDGFVIKFTAKTDKDINDKESLYKIKRLDSNGKYIVDSGLKDLEMVQNYLRVARRGTNQNYEHWLTDFLEFLDDDNSQFDEIKEIKEFVDNFLSNKDKNVLPKSLIKNESQKDESLTEKLRVLQEELVAFLEEKDTEQIYNVNLKEHYKQNGNFTIDESFLTKYLSNGVKTPHYWFYRLEYYLWKWGKYAPEKLGDFSKTLGDYTLDLKKDKCVLNSKYFHFRILGSIEHFSATQREKPQEQWSNVSDSLNIFGNLALISQNLNSSLSNKLEKFKRNKVIEQLERGRLESLKYFIMCANLKGDEWTGDNAQEHQNQMLEILKQSLKISSHNLTPQQSLKIKEY